MNQELKDFLIGYACLCMGLLIIFALLEYMSYPYTYINYKKYYNALKYRLIYFWFYVTIGRKSAKIIRFPVERTRKSANPD